MMAAEILAVTPSPPPAKKKKKKSKSRRETKDGDDDNKAKAAAGGGGTNPFDDGANEDGKGGTTAAVRAAEGTRAKSNKSGGGGESESSQAKQKKKKKKKSSSGGGGRLRPPQPQPATNPFDDGHVPNSTGSKPPPSPLPSRRATSSSTAARSNSKSKSRVKSHRRSETAPAAAASSSAALNDDPPPPLAELAIRTRSFGGSARRSRAAGSSSRSRAGGDESVHAVGSVMSGKSAKSGRSGKSSTNPFDDDGDESESESDVSDHDDDGSSHQLRNDNDGDEDHGDESSAASTHVSDLSLRSARSVALAAVLAARRDSEKAAAAAAKAKTKAKDDGDGDGGNGEGDGDEESRWEEGSDGEWRKVGGGDKKADAAGGASVGNDAHEKDGRWEEGSDGEWRRVVDGNETKTDKDDDAKDDTPDEKQTTAKGSDALQQQNDEDEDEESSRELWEEGSDGEWRRVVKASSSKDEGPGQEADVDDTEDTPKADQANEKAAADKVDDVPQEEDGVWEEDSDGDWRLVPKTKSGGAPVETPPAQVSIDEDSEHADEEAEAEQAANKTSRPRKEKLNPFDDSSGSADKAEASRSSSGPVDLDESESDSDKSELEEGSGPIDLDEVDSIDDEKDGSGPIDLDEVDSLVASDQSQKDGSGSSSSGSDSDSAANDSDELDDELREQIERRRAEDAAAAAVAATNAQHPLLADPMTPRYALDHSGPTVPADTSPSGPSLLARAKAKREAEDRVKAELAEKKAKEREMMPPRGIPAAIGGVSFDATSTVMSPGDQKSHTEVSTTANSTLQRSVKSYGEQSEASSANAVAILPSLVNVQALSDLDRIPSGRRIDHFSSASPSHRRVESQDSGGGGSSAANALSAREAIMAAASRHRSRFGSSRGHSARVSFDSNDPTASVKSTDSNSTGPSQSSGRPPLLDRSSRAVSLGKKFMTPLERQRELRRSQRMMASSAVDGAASFDQGRMVSSGPGLGDGLARLKEISGEDVSVAARGDEFSIAPSLGGTVATEVTDQKDDKREVKMNDVPEAAESVSATNALPSLDETAASETTVLRDFNAGLLRGFADTTAAAAEAPPSPTQSPSRAASSPGSSPRRRMSAARSKMKNVLSTMATVDKMKQSPTKQSPTKQSPRRVLVRPNFQKEEQGKSEVKNERENPSPSPSSDNNKPSANSSSDDAPIVENSSAEESDAESDCDDESIGGASISFGVPPKPAALPLRSHPEYSKYFAMLKASVPPSFVRRVCEIDGRDPAVLDMDPEMPYEPQKSTCLPPAVVPKKAPEELDDEAAAEENTQKSEDEPLQVVTDGTDIKVEPNSKDPSPRGVAEVDVSHQMSEENNNSATEPSARTDTSKVAALFANRSASGAAVGSKPPRPPPGKLSGSGKGDVAALFAARASESDTKPKAPAPGKLKDSGKGDVAKLFTAHAGESDEVKEKPKPGKLSDTGKGDVAAMFAARSAEADPSSKAKPGKLSDSGKGDVAALFAARSKAAKPSLAPDVELSTPVSAAAEKIEQKEQENKDATRPPLKKDPEFAKYFKMLSMGIPMGAVQQALARDGKDPAIMDMDHDKPYSSNPEAKTPERPSLRDDPEFAKYFKMLKMGLPMGAVKQAMTRDGADPSVMDMDHDKPLPSISSAGENNASAKKVSPAKSKVVRKKLFWTSIDKSTLDKDSLWAQAQQESQNMEGLDYDMEEFATLFTQQKGKKSKSPSRDGPKRKKKALVQLIDGRREMNASIVLRKFKHDYKQLAEDLRKLDVGSMDENEVRAHMQLLPTKDEVKSIEAYLSKSKTEEEKEEAISKLGECEKYMIAMMGVQEAAKKFQCLLYRAQFDTRVEEIEVEVKDLKEACKCVRSSDRLRKLLVFALRLGNTLNTGGSGESASAITLDSLLKMHEAKAFDKQTSVLHYLVSVIEKNDKDVLNVKDDLEPAKKAERIVAEGLKKSLADLSNGLDTVNEMGLEEAQRQAKGKGDKNLVADVNSVLAQTNIGQFAISADVRLKVLSAELNEAVEACTGLLTYFGEDAVMPSDVFFSTLNGFIAMFGTALEDNRRREKAKARKAKLAEKQKSGDGTASRKQSFASNSKSSLADSRSKILFELSTGAALSKLKPVGQSSSSKPSVDGNDSKDDDKESKEKEKEEKLNGGDNMSADKDNSNEDDGAIESEHVAESEKNGTEKDNAKIDEEDSDEDDGFEDAVETEEASAKELEAFGDASDSQEEHKEECVIS